MSKKECKTPDQGAVLYSTQWWGEWKTVDPVSFLELLKKNPNIPLFLKNAPENWIQLHHLNRLVDLLDSGVPASATGYLASAHIPPKDFHSTIGQEAARMIDSYRNSLPYPGNFSDLNKINVQEIKQWWREQKK